MKKKKMNNEKYQIFTVGHSNHSLETFVTLLQRYGVTALVDVRSAPFSRFSPQFNKVDLEQEIKTHGIKYVFLGRELGARPEDSSCYENGQVQYERLKDRMQFKEGIERVIRGAKQHVIALMCSEKDPLQCHRFLLVARALVKLDILVAHILATGDLEPHEITMARLPDPAGSAQDDLFDSKEELILSSQEKRVAYVNKKQASKKQSMA